MSTKLMHDDGDARRRHRKPSRTRMAASSLLALIDDISALLDDVATLTKVAATKTSGVMGDDLALNAEQVSGVRVERELPVVWAVAKGSFVNKLILVPMALAISAFAPVAIMPLMMIGGLFLCYEGFEKVAHKLLHADDEKAHAREERVRAIANPAVDLVAFERDRIKGAIRTDFVLSAEIVVITLGTMSAAPLNQQVLALSIVALGATVLVYGLVAGIVKLDDLGRSLLQRSDAWAKQSGTVILRAAPVLMKLLSILGTAAMFTVGGGILVHGVPPVDHLIESVTTPIAANSALLAGVVKAVLDAVVGLVAGGLVVGVLEVAKKIRGPGASAKPEAG